MSEIKFKIALFEDDPDYREGLVTFLTANGFLVALLVTTLGEVDSALDQLATAGIEAVILDGCLRGGDCEDAEPLARRIKALYPHLPLVGQAGSREIVGVDANFPKKGGSAPLIAYLRSLASTR